MAERNARGRRERGPRGSIGGALRMLLRAGARALRVPVVLLGWFLALATMAALLWLTVGLEEGLSLPGIALVYVLRTILASVLFALVALPAACALPRGWREKARKLSNRQVVVAVVMTMALVAIFVALEAARAFQ